VPLQHPDGKTALEKGGVDAWAGLDPYTAQLEVEKGYLLFFRNKKWNSYGILNVRESFAKDHPEIVKNIQAVFNQDNGTGRVVNLAGQGFLHSYEYLSRWMSKVPAWIRDSVKTTFPGTPGGGGSDFASFIAAGAPAFSLGSLNWSYFSYTWHTNRDTYDKIIFDDLRNNAILAAALAYMASEDPVKTSREKSVLPLNLKTGQPSQWPAQVKSTRKGGVD